MKKLLSAACLLLMFCVGANADVVIASRHQVQNPNLHGGYCAFACAETAALASGYSHARGLVHARTQYPAQHVCRQGHCSWRQSGAARVDLADVQGQLSARGVPTTRCSGSHCHAVLHESISSGKPAIVGIQLSATSAHAVIPHAIDRTGFYYYDPNYPGRVFRMDRDKFYRQWQGSVVVVGR